MNARVAGLVCALASLPGCITLGRPAPPVRDYLLEYEPPAVAHERLPVVLRVAPFTVAPMYAGPGIVYRAAAHRIGTYTYDRWATEPSAMIADLLARDFASSGVYEAVLHGPSLLRSDYELSGEVEELGERDSSGCVARVQLRLLLRRSGRAREGKAVLFQRPYQAEEPCRENDAPQLVAAMSRAMQRISAQVQEDVYAAIAADAQHGADSPGVP